MANELAELENRQFLNIAQSLLPFATDTSLDLLGEIFGVPRLPQTTASVNIGDQNFQWYVRNGTFGAINSGQDINIPAGTRIYTAAGVNGPVYIANAVTLPAAASSMSFSAHGFVFRRGRQRPRRDLLAVQLHQLHRERLRIAAGDQQLRDCGRRRRRA